MDITYVPLLRTLHDLYGMPRNRERFQRYLETVTEGTGEVILPPLVAANPMAKPHVAARIEELLALDADTIAADATRETTERLAGVDDDPLLVGLVVVDDVGGGWSDRNAMEAAGLFPPPRRKGYRADADQNRWVTAVLWASETPSAETVRHTVAAAIFRAAWQRRAGLPATLAVVLKQEGLTSVFAGAGPHLSTAESVRARELVHRLAAAPATPYPAAVAAALGDSAAESLGYDPLGLPARAGLAVAYEDIRTAEIDPVAALAAVSRP